MQALKYYKHELYAALFRKKLTTHEYSKLNKVLNLLDVTFLSLGTTFGVGPYIFIGRYAKLMGPAMILAYVVAAIMIFLSAACYAELTSRAGGSGGAYSCAYIYIGELPATIIGWHICLQNIIGSALSIRGVSDLFEFKTDYLISNYIKKNIIEFHTPMLGEYPDFVSFCIVIVIVTVLTFGLKEVSIINNLLVVFNLIQLLVIVLMSGSLMELKYWKLPPKEGCGNGGFMPYGFKNMALGTGQVLYAFLGFDAAVHAAAECHEPERIIPLALIISNATVFVIYMLQSVVYTLSWPYCDQELEDPVSYVFKSIGLSSMSWITVVGVPVALMGSVLSSKFPLSRVLYAMSEDGLFYSYMAELKLRTKVPVNALYTSGLLTGICATLFNKMQLLELTCLSTLLAYSIISVMVIYLRYTDPRMEDSKKKGIIGKLFNIHPRALVPTKTTSSVVAACCWLIILVSQPFMLVLYYKEEYIDNAFREASVICSAVLFYISIVTIISCQPKSQAYLSFKIKCVPILPMLSVLMNSFLSTTYSYYTWLRLALFIALGMFTYLTYGVWNSQLRKVGDQFY